MPKSKNDKPAAKPSVKKAAEEDASSVAKKETRPTPRPGNNHFAVITPVKAVEIKDPFLKRQKERLLQLRDGMLDSMSGVARDTLRSRAEGSEASAFGMHQADAGSDAYDRDFALSLLSQEQDALYEIDEALKRIDQGTYGICELCNKPILHARLEAIPFARFTVDCQSQLEKQRKMTRSRQPVTSLFGLTDEEGGASEGEEEETVTETKE
jgi:RNA polymerase-binding transcription factor DksA